jgi:hypothetical protein
MIVVNLGDKKEIDLQPYQEMLSKGSMLKPIFNNHEQLSNGMLQWNNGESFEVFELVLNPTKP